MPNVKLAITPSGGIPTFVRFISADTETTYMVDFESEGSPVTRKIASGEYLVVCYLEGKDADNIKVTAAVGGADPHQIISATLHDGGDGTRDIGGGRLVGTDFNRWVLP